MMPTLQSARRRGATATLPPPPPINPLALLLQRPLCLLSLLLLLFPQPSRAKIVSGSARLTGVQTERTLTKFAMSPKSHGKLVLDLHSVDMYEDESGLRLHMYADADWKKVKKAPTCGEKIRLAKRSIPITFDLNRNPDRDKLMRHKKNKPKKGRGGGDGGALWEAKVESIVPGFETDRPQYWYFTLDDCSLEVYLHDDKAPRMEYTLTVWDDTSGGTGGSPEDAIYSHVPADEAGMARLHLMTAVVSSALVFVILYKIATSLKSGGSVHAALLIVLTAAGCDAVSSIFEMAHLRLFASNGVGSYVLDALSAHFEAMSDSLVALVLLSVGSGWTLPSDVVGSTSSNEGFLSKLVCGLRSPAAAATCGGGPAGVLALSILAAHAALAQWGRTFDEEFDCYHSLENPPGRVLMYFRIILGLAFLAGVASVRNGGRCPKSLLPFLTKFALVGSAWFISLPFVSLFVASSLPFHRRHQALSAGAAVVQSCSLASLAWLFTADSDASAYHRLSKVQGGGADLTDMAASSSSAGGGRGGGGGGDSAPIGRVPPKTWKFGKAKVRLD